MIYYVMYVMPFIRVAGSAVFMSPMERAGGMSKLYAMTQTYDAPSYFLTVAMDEGSSMLNIRLSSPIHDNNLFPAIAAGLQDAIFKELREHYKVDITPHCLSKLSAEHPVTAAVVFEHPLIEKNDIVRISLSSSTSV